MFFSPYIAVIAGKDDRIIKVYHNLQKNSSSYMQEVSGISKVREGKGKRPKEQKLFWSFDPSVEIRLRCRIFGLLAIYHASLMV